MKKRYTTYFIVSIILVTKMGIASLTAVEFFNSEDIKRSSQLLLKTQQNRYEANAEQIVDPLTQTPIGEIICGEKDRIDVVLRGTNNPQEMIDNLVNITPIPLNQLGFSDHNSRGHAGFVQATQNVKSQVIRAVSSFQEQKELESEVMKIVLHGNSRGTAISSLLATSLQNIYSKTPIYVLNHASLPFLNSTAEDEYHRIINPNNHLNFICQEDGVVKVINDLSTNMDLNMPGTKLTFSASQYPEFKNRIGNYSFFSGGVFGQMALNLVGIDAQGWEGHIPLTYLHSADAFNLYKISTSSI